MAWSDPGDFTSGQILTASQMDAVREAMFFGQATFTNEAARDAAIPATGITLQEGMRTYLTAPTVPAATGASTALPSGITTIYNGSAWVCMTPIGARSSTDGTTTSGSYASTLTGDATAISVTLVTGTSALISLSMFSACAVGVNTLMSVTVSGATTLASSDDNAVRADSNGYLATSGSTFILTGLTAGTNTFTAQYKAGAGGATIYERRLVVVGIA